MSKSDIGHDLLQVQSITDEELSIQRSSEVLTTRRDRESVTPIAKDMVENVVTGALSILDVSRKEGKPWKVVLAEAQNPPDVDEDSGNFASLKDQTSNPILSVDAQRPAVQVMQLRFCDDVVCDSVHAEQVAKIVKGLQDIQIGDSTYVLPMDGSNIEKQVKRAVRNINNLEFGDMETAQLIICDGQGDVDAAILEAEVGPPSNVNSKPQHDASKVSTCFLHKMIEELEDSDSTKVNSPDHSNKEGIAIWEESEEKFIRIIEGPGDERASALMRNQEYDPANVHEELSPIGPGTDAENRDIETPLDQGQHGFNEDGIIHKGESNNRPRDLLDNNSVEEPYWCTAGLITGAAATPEHSEIFASKTTMSREESETMGIEGNLESRRTTDNFETVDRDLEVNGNKKKSFGKRLRHFFSRFTRRKRC